MGMFDTIVVRCPKCGSGNIEWQTKAMPHPSLSTWRLRDIPAIVAADIEDSDDGYARHLTKECPQCGHRPWLRAQVMSVVSLSDEDPDEYPEDYE